MQPTATSSLIIPTGLTGDQQRLKRNHPKVRTGCSTCKARRIKCDELKPVCTRCKLAHRQCVYIVPKVWIFEPQKEPPCLLNSPSSITLGNLEERRAFDFFKQSTAPQFAGQHDVASKFLERLHPKDCYFRSTDLQAGGGHGITTFSFNLWHTRIISTGSTVSRNSHSNTSTETLGPEGGHLASVLWNADGLREFV